MTYLSPEQPPIVSESAKTRSRAAFDSTERLLIGLIAAIFVVNIALAAAKDQAVAWSAFAISQSPALGLLLVGLYLRGPKAAPRLSQWAIANAIYIGFSGAIAILIYLRFPIGKPLIDDALHAADAAFGFEWSGFVNWLAQYPAFGSMLGPVYLSSLPQLFLLIGILAWTAQSARLNQALLTGTLSLVLTVGFWSMWPSIGPSAYEVIPTETAKAIGLFHDSRLGAKLIGLVENGTPLIHPGDIMGTIAFPSYHTVMLFMMVWFIRGTVLFWPALVLNILMVPAILSHGGHYLTDLFGGFITFAIAACIAARIAPEGVKSLR